MNKPTNEKFTYDEVFRSASNCDQTERVQLYFLRLLSESENQEVEKHLQFCDHCANILADLEESETALTNVVLDAKKADKIFDLTRKQINERLDPRFNPTFHQRSFWTSFQIPAYVTVLAIVLMSLLIYPSYRSLLLTGKVEKLEKELELAKQQPKIPKQLETITEETSASLQPELSSSAIYPVRTERSSENQIIDVIFSDAAKTFSVVLSLPAGDFERYLVKISQAGKSVWQKEFPSLSTSSMVSVNLKAGYFQPGNYKLHVYGKIGEIETEISQFQLRIRHR
jgi:hypothetical protein